MSKSIQCERVSFTWRKVKRDPTEALREVSLYVEAGQLVTLIGPTGSGKSTLLRMMGGLERPKCGRVLLDGTPVAGPTAKIGMVFQEPLLFPWLTVRDNVEFGLRVKGIRAASRKESALQLLGTVGLASAERRYPHELSGGMRQRVAVARALIADPDVLLMDEPFAALDVQTRMLMAEWLLSIWQRCGKTIVFVTHSIDEAILLSDSVVVMRGPPGTIVEKVTVPLSRPRSIVSDECNRLRRYLTEHILREGSLAFKSGASRCTEHGNGVSA